VRRMAEIPPGRRSDSLPRLQRQFYYDQTWERRQRLSTISGPADGKSAHDIRLPKKQPASQHHAVQRGRSGESSVCRRAFHAVPCGRTVVAAVPDRGSLQEHRNAGCRPPREARGRIELAYCSMIRVEADFGGASGIFLGAVPGLGAGIGSP